MASVIFTMPRHRWPDFGADLVPWRPISGPDDPRIIRKDARPYHPEHTPDPARKTPGHGVVVPTISVKHHTAGNARAIAEHLRQIDYMITIADAYVTGNGDPVEKSVDTACREVLVYLTPTTRANVIAYLSED